MSAARVLDLVHFAKNAGGRYRAPISDLKEDERAEVLKAVETFATVDWMQIGS